LAEFIVEDLAAIPRRFSGLRRVVRDRDWLLDFAIVVLILLFTGWKGREMVYAHHVGRI
jgi:hypothetical protein